MRRFLVNPTVTWSGSDGRLTQEGFNQLKDLHNELGRIRGLAADDVDLESLSDEIDALDARITILENIDYSTQWSSEIATTTGTAHDFTTIPAGVETVLIAFKNLSLSGTDNILVQIGAGSSFTTTGYVSRSSSLASGVTTTADTTAFIIRAANASAIVCGTMRLTRAAGNLWMSDHNIDNGVAVAVGAGMLDLGGEISRVRVTRSGTNTFDAGSFFVGYR